MNARIREVIEGFRFVGSANALTLAIATLSVFIVPKLVDAEGYGYWQLYLFYSAYVGFFHLGWVDGVYLRYGGKSYESLDRGLLSSQFRMLLVLESVIGTGVLLGAFVLVDNRSRSVVLMMTGGLLVLANLRYLILYVLQITGRFQDYARILMVDRLVYVLSLAGFLVSGQRSFEWLVLADLLGKVASLVLGGWMCRDLVCARPVTLGVAITEAKANLGAGWKLLAANVASLLIFGVVRLGIESQWGIAVFGGVSLTLNVSNLLMVFVGALGSVVYPILRRTREARLSNAYEAMSDVLMVALLLGMFVFYPMHSVIAGWLPGYSQALKYMTILVPLCLFEGRVALLVNPFFNALRRERDLLLVNVCSFGVSLVGTTVFAIIMRNLDLTVLLILGVSSFRCTLAEVLLSRRLRMRLWGERVSEVLLLVVFIGGAWAGLPFQGAPFYLIAFIGYLFFRRRRILARLSALRGNGD